ncbi:hypothetical protein Xenpb_03910 [Xenorhabdus sp. PB62.4]|nr:hypothetical protein [Xenorhabdus sp. PB62.4]
MVINLQLIFLEYLSIDSTPFCIKKPVPLPYKNKKIFSFKLARSVLLTFLREVNSPAHRISMLFFYCPH